MTDKNREAFEALEVAKQLREFLRYCAPDMEDGISKAVDLLEYMQNQQARIDAMPTFIVMAFRWGWTNQHQYLVCAGHDREMALTAAEEECSDRAGKYGVVVYAVTGYGEDFKMERVAYHPSSYGETEPHSNFRIEMFESLGHRLYDYANGTLWQPGEKNTIKPVNVMPEQWAVDLVREKEKTAETLGELSKKSRGTTWESGDQAHEQVILEQVAEIDALRARIAELEQQAAGNGEAVAWQCSIPGKWIGVTDDKDKVAGYRQHADIVVTPLYTAPPAPVVVLPAPKAWMYARQFGSGVQFPEPPPSYDEDGKLEHPVPLYDMREFATITAAELDGLRRDAGRYRWLRSTTHWATNSDGERIDVLNKPELWDEVIDAARNGGKGNE